MPVHRVSQPVLAFRWNRRKQVCQWSTVPGYPSTPVEGTSPVVRIVEDVRHLQDEEQLTNTFRELSSRQYEAMKQLLIEAKTKSETMLRDENIASDPGKLAYYAGWIAYADYVINSFETFRAETPPPDKEE